MRISALISDVCSSDLVSVVPLELPAAAASAALVFAEELRQRPFIDAQELDVDLVDVDRHHRQAARLLRRQHAALRREADGRIEFPGVDALLDVAAEPGAVGSQQLARHLHGEILVRTDVRIAQDLARIVQRPAAGLGHGFRSEEHTSELQSLMRISYAVFCLKKKKKYNNRKTQKSDTYISHIK